MRDLLMRHEAGMVGRRRSVGPHTQDTSTRTARARSITPGPEILGRAAQDLMLLRPDDASPHIGRRPRDPTYEYETEAQPLM